MGLDRILLLTWALCLALALPAAGLRAQEAEENSEIDEGMSLLQQGAQLMLRGLMSEAQPQLDEMQRNLQGFGDKMGEAMAAAEPYLAGLIMLMDDIGNYQPPERLPNGDILLRRKPDAPPVLPEAPQTEL